ncbi:type I-E CRISPR-associated protein Cse2/CasB [Nesterenkonia sp. CL21]|uniref:type I-E CRISPR-associated protein Cse2/CasB n=1 Tax=Nesterenkonia sp. CL21 TaxID=3064894 RepID=UPI0028799AA0|nr:type I-E CRISPR-associated protein Cse2/CasB [Nesterenkonia sp. CL21]MDS2172676.1 type I-E CRISPR-associated protein Cse2/CasB [Nesterenkonia sp. CL21]
MSTDTAPTSDEAPDVAPDLARTVSAAVHRLQSEVTHDRTRQSGSSRAVVATLRNASGFAPGDHARAWTLVLEEMVPDIHAYWLPTDEPSRQEWAAYTAITHWALHQQSQSKPMHISAPRRDQNLGYAAGLLSSRRGSASIKSRFDALLLNPGDNAARHHLRSMVQLLRTEEIPTDYGLLAQDLAVLRGPGGRRRVSLRWGRGYAWGASASPEDGPSDS